MTGITLNTTPTKTLFVPKSSDQSMTFVKSWHSRSVILTVTTNRNHFSYLIITQKVILIETKNVYNLTTRDL